MTCERLRVAWTLAPLVLMLSSPALAGGKDDARTYFVEGLTAAQQHDYRLAVGNFLASWEAFEHPTTALNIARAYEDYGDLERALVWYRRFQEMAPHRADEAADAVLRVTHALDPIDAAKDAATEAEIAALKARLAALESGESHPVAATPPPDDAAPAPAEPPPAAPAADPAASALPTEREFEDAIRRAREAASKR
ncbi:MAG: hypothetical protein H6733_11320 [Alphaproteobacteria bacterium]|nr:hypothetical protein [Alphaproteobacteria bacterium]